MNELPPTVTRVLLELGEDALGGKVTMANHAVLDNVVVLRCEERDPTAWVAVIPVHSDAAGVATAIALEALMEPPCRVVAVGLMERCTNTRSRAEVDFFTEAELQYNALRHEDQPSMRRVSPKEASALVDDAMALADASSLPIMLRNDIVARYYGFRQGDVIRCDRHTPSGDVSYYRYVT